MPTSFNNLEEGVPLDVCSDDLVLQQLGNALIDDLNCLRYPLLPDQLNYPEPFGEQKLLVQVERLPY